MTSNLVVSDIVIFGRILRAAGFEIGPGRICDALRGLDRVDLVRQEDVYWTLRQTLVSRAEDLDIFDRAFATWFLRAPVFAAVRVETPVQAQGERGSSRIGSKNAVEIPVLEGRAVGWSPDERLRHKEFSELTEGEFAQLRRLTAVFAAKRPRRCTRRLRHHSRGVALDMRGLVRASLVTGGDPVDRAVRRRIERNRKMIVLCDVSGSMERYSRAILLFAHGLVRSGRAVEAFAFGTRLTRLTAELSRRDPQRALDEASQRVVDWSGGTRIGASLKAFNDLWGRRALSRGAVVVIVSDGWEREDAAAVGREMARLARCAYAVVWVNPLKDAPDYEPLAGGMRAALPYIDRFLPGHDLASLEDLGDVFASIERRHAA